MTRADICSKWMAWLSAAALLGGNVAFAQDPVSADWLALAQRSSAVVIGELIGPQQTIERAEERTPELIRQADGAYRITVRPTEDYVAGRLWRARVAEVVNGDGRAAVGAVIPVFHEGQLIDAQAGQRFLLFLRAPIVLARALDQVSGWRTLYGTLLTSEDSDEEMAFDPSHAYSIVFPTRLSMAQAALAVTPENSAQIEAIKSAIHAQGLPSARLIAPKAAASLRGLVSVSAVATDDIGVLGVQFRLDDRDLGAEVGPQGLGAVAMSWDTSATSDGPHVLTAVARDATGNRVSSVPVPVVVDNTPPALQLRVEPASLWPADGRLVTVKVGVTVSDAQDANPSVTLLSIGCEDRSRAQIGIPENGQCSGLTDIVGAKPGTDDREFQLRAVKTRARTMRVYTITYAAHDAAGNQTIATFTVQVSAPGASDQ